MVYRFEVIVNDRQNSLAIAAEKVYPLVRAVTTLHNEKYDEVGIHFVDVATISRLHRDYFDDPSPTDCISFPVDSFNDGDGSDDSNDRFRMMGDVFVCPEVAIGYVKEHGGEPYEELSLYVVHGLLHLMGYDDLSEEDRRLMREKEKEAMDHLRQQGSLLFSNTLLGG